MTLRSLLPEYVSFWCVRRKTPILLFLDERETVCLFECESGSVRNGCRRKIKKFLIDYQGRSPLSFLLLSCSIWWLDCVRGLWGEEAGVCVGVWVSESVREREEVRGHIYYLSTPPLGQPRSPLIIAKLCHTPCLSLSVSLSHTPILTLHARKHRQMIYIHIYPFTHSRTYAYLHLGFYEHCDKIKWVEARLHPVFRALSILTHTQSERNNE